VYTPFALGGAGTGFERISCFNDPPTIDLVASFSLAALKEQLAASFAALGSDYKFDISPHTSEIRYVLDQLGGLLKHPRDIHVMLFRLQDWNNVATASGEYEGVHPHSKELIEHNLRRMVAALHDAADACFGTVVLVLCPLTDRYRLSSSATAYFKAIEFRLREELADIPHFFVVNADGCLPSPDRSWDSSDPDDPPFSAAFYERAARKIVRACYAAESRPWKGLVLSADHYAAADRLSLSAFVNKLWRAGRRLALVGRGKAPDSTDNFAVCDFSSAPLNQKLQNLSAGLLLPDKELMFLGSAKECQDILLHTPHVLALPVLDEESSFDSLVSELWCLDPMLELWLTDPLSMTPTLPRLSARILMDIARNPDLSVEMAVSRRPPLQASGVR